MEQDLSKYIGTKLKLYRLQNKLTQEELAASIGTTKATISNYETGYRTPQQDALFQLANVLNVQIDDFFPERQSSASNIDKTTIIMKKLDETRREVVYKCAEEQLKAQNSKLVPFPSQEPKKELVPIESYGAVSAGSGEFLFGVERAETVYLPKNDLPDEPFDYVLKINGDSMLPTYEDGEYIYVKSFSNGGHARSGMLAIVMYDNEVYFKKLYFDDSGVRLVSLNKEYEDIVITDPSCFQVLGKVVA